MVLGIVLALNRDLKRVWSLAYVYSRETKDAAVIAKVLTEDEARRIASNIAKLPSLLGKGDFAFFFPERAPITRAWRILS